VRRRRDQGPPGLHLNDGTWRRAVHQAHHTGRVGTLVGVYLEPVPGLQVYIYSIDTDLFAGIIAHATLGTLRMINAQRRHNFPHVRLQFLDDRCGLTAGVSTKSAMPWRAVV